VKVTSTDAAWIQRQIDEKIKWLQGAGKLSRPIIRDYLKACQTRLEEVQHA
jgi:hypothetical protein